MSVGSRTRMAFECSVQLASGRPPVGRSPPSAGRFRVHLRIRNSSAESQHSSSIRFGIFGGDWQLLPAATDSAGCRRRTDALRSLARPPVGCGSAEAAPVARLWLDWGDGCGPAETWLVVVAQLDAVLVRRPAWCTPSRERAARRRGASSSQTPTEISRPTRLIGWPSG